MGCTSQYHIELDKADKQRVMLDQEYERMRLAQAQAANLQLIKNAAESQLLRAPSINDIKLIKHWSVVGFARIINGCCDEFLL